MKIDSWLATLAVGILMNACGGEHASDPRLDDDDESGATDGNADAGTAETETDDAGNSNDDDKGEAGAPNRDGVDNVGGTSSDVPTAAGGANGNGAGSGGSGRSSVGGASTGGGTHNSAAGDAGIDGPSPGSAGRAGNGGSGGRADNGGSGSIVTTSGSGGVSTSAGAGGLAENAGAAGLAGAGSSDHAAGSSGSGGISGSDGSGGVAGSGGSAGLAGSGGSAGSAGDGAVVSLDPEFLFTKEEFGGNGRTCITCHFAETGTISPAQVQALYSSDPDAPLFRPIDSDDGASDDYTQLRERATFRVTVDLPPGVTLTSDPTATSVVFRRGVPTTLNTPALDPVIMWDGRARDLKDQALGAILGHSEATITPTDEQLERIIEFEKGSAFFSSDLLRNYSQGGSAPTWPEGVTEAEQRGRRWFAQSSAAPRFNICGQCHGGPMTNETQSNSGLPVGKHFQTANVSEFNTLGNPSYEFTFPDPRNPGRTVKVVTPDPGRALVTGDARDVNFFKIPTLWGVQHTAPYFHDNSARTLEELMDHYEKHLATFLSRNFRYPTPHVPTAQDKADIIAYLKLL